MFKDTKMGQTNSFTSIAQVVIEGMKEFDERFEDTKYIFRYNETMYDGLKSHINETIIKVLEAIEKEVGRKIRTCEDTFECPHCEEDLRGIVNNEFSPIQQLLNSTKEQIK